MSRLTTATAMAAVLMMVGVVHASITPNPDSWELPPASPNYVYNSQGLLGTGALSTLVTIRDPKSSTDMSYNTSFFAFSVSGGLVPLNYLDLNDAHCYSVMVADILICDFQGDTQNAQPTKFFQLSVRAGTGGANRVFVADTLGAPFNGAFGAIPPVVVQSTGRLLMAQWSTTPDGEAALNFWELDRMNATGEGLELISLGSPLPASAVGTFVTAITLNADDSQLIVNAELGVFVLAFPSLALLQNLTTGNFDALWLVSNQYNIGVGVNTLTMPPYGLTYTTFDLTADEPTGPVTTDKASGFLSAGVYMASAATSYNQVVGPCIYVNSANITNTAGTTTILSQLTMPADPNHGAAIETQISLGGTAGTTLVANEQYVFVIISEIMYRYIASC